MLQLTKKDGDSSTYSLDQAVAGKILVLDDNLQVLDVLENILSMHGYEVLSASEGRRALSLLELEPDLIVCDIMMPDMDGFAFYEEVNKNKGWCHIPFLFLTALDRPDEVRKAKAIGCDDYLTKPFEPEDLLAAIKGKVKIAKRRSESQEELLEGYRKRIIHTLSHEFRTPLVSINTGTELLLDRYEDLEKANVIRLLESIQRGGQRLQRLVEDFMTLQQISAGLAVAAYQRNKKATNILDVLEKAIESFQDTLSLNTNLLLEYQIDSALKKSQAIFYEVHVHDILLRILSNAYKFGGAENPITISLRTPEKGYISLFIRDRGQGIGDEVWDQAQVLFTQIDREKQEQQGCGLGLSIAGYYAGINGGEILFHKPSEGEGLEVEIRLKAQE